MVTTPTVWKDEFGLTTFTNSAQLDPVFTDIGNGRFVAVWTDFGGGVGKFGVNVIAQIFDAEGNAVGDPFLANESAASQFEQQPAVTGRPGGGFAVAYFDNELGLTDKERIIVDIFDVDGNHVGGKVIQADDADAVSNPSIAMRSDGSYLVTYIREHTSGDGTFDVVGRRVSSSGTVGSEFTIFDSTDTSTNMADHTAETAVLSNGSYVVAYTALTTDHDPQFKIIGQTGAVSSGTGFQISLSSNDETDIQVAALANGGFVAVWQTDNDGSGSGIRFSVYDNNGAAVKANQFGGGIAVNTTTSGEQVTPDVTALADGGFVVVWDDDQRSGTYGQRFDASGNKVGGEFLVHSGTAGDQAVAALSDGRFVTGFKTNGSSSDVFGAIFDPRTSPVNGTSGDDVLTSRQDGGTVNGLGGADTLLGQAANDTLDGGDGDDILSGGPGKDMLLGRGGKDVFVFDEALGAANADKIKGFKHKKDSIFLDKDVFAAVGTKVSKKEYFEGKKAHDGNDHIIRKGNKLFYDEDGKGGKKQVLFAKLDKKAVTDHHDFDVGDFVI